MLNCQPCLDFDQLRSSFRDGPEDQTRNLEIPGSLVSVAPRNDGGGRLYVSTNPVLDPLAAESLWPWGSAR